ncbi:MAG: FeoA family protein [Euryarchaeota archaeon]|nr:FeoA family protein [Euryarchaeota archaeon]
MQLSNVKEGSTVRIISIHGGRGIRGRLTKMGVHPGDLGTVERNSFGPVLLKVRGNSVALGRGVAAKVEVSMV